MPEEQFIDPGEVRQPDKIDFEEIPLNQYQKSAAEEQKNYTREELLRIYRDMKYIREFETMISRLKNEGSYQGVKHDYLGPAHLYLGQEAAAVGQAFVLGNSDFILGSHRSHGEIIAKGLSAIEQYSAEELEEIMQDYAGGRLYEIVKNNLDADSDIKDRAVNFLFYGLTAELLAKETGFNRGLGGSMHAFFTPFGIYPNNAIVGGSAPIAAGCALFKKVRQKEGIVIANIGDGSLGCGPVWEAINFSAMSQYDELWAEDYQGGLPILFNFLNNQYGMGGQTAGETMAFDKLARFGAGVNSRQLHAERVDGYNPLAVIDAVQRKKKIITENRGPVLLDTLTYRLTGHSPSDSNTYRTEEEIEAWEQVDSIQTYKEELLKNEITDSSEIKEIDEEIQHRLTEICRISADDEISPYLEDPEEIGRLMFSDKKEEIRGTGKPDVLIPKEENSRVKRLANRERSAFKEGQKVSSLKQYSIRDALFEAIINKCYEDPSLTIYGEDNRDWGGAFAVYNGLTESLPYHRFFNAPISEAAICGSAVGYALSGGRPLVELMYADFIGRAGDEIFNQMAKWQSMSAGQLDMPLVLRVSIGNKYGAQHSQDWTSLVSHIPGLKVVFPVTPYDTKGLMTSALNGTDPVIFFEKQKLYGKGEEFRTEKGVPEEDYEIPLGEPDIKRKGEDLTVLSLGATLYRVIEAAEILAEEHNISTEVIDARSVVPFNYEKVVASVQKTGRIIVTGDACERGSHLNDFAQKISELAFNYLDGPPVVVGSRNWITPATELEEAFFPQPEWIVDAVHQKILPLKGHKSEHNFSSKEKMKRDKKGI